MGKRTQPCLRLLEQRLTDLRKRTAEALAFLVPTLPSISARRFAQAMQDGVPAPKAALDAIAPTIWEDLLKAAVGEPALRESIAALAARCPEGEIAVGIKETNFRQDSTDGDGDEPAGEGRTDPQEEETAEMPLSEAGTPKPEDPMARRVVWFAFSIYSEDRQRPGNAVAIEAATRAGRATYLFRIAPPEVYREASVEGAQGPRPRPHPLRLAGARGAGVQARAHLPGRRRHPHRALRPLPAGAATVGAAQGDPRRLPRPRHPQPGLGFAGRRGARQGHRRRVETLARDVAGLRALRHLPGREGSSMIGEISVTPIGSDITSMRAYVEDAVEAIRETGVPYRVTEMGTNVEGSFDDLLRAFRAAHDACVRRGVGRVMASLRVDDRLDQPEKLEQATM
ncbi:MAG: MTH1187 family thiamine-binding protein [Myxococcales bacterium]